MLGRLSAAGLTAFCFVLSPAHGESEDLGGGFMHHGVATPVSNHRGTVATVDGDGRNVVLVWLFDHRGGYALLMIDVETGDADEIPMSFDPGGDCPYSSILSTKNKFYTHFNSHFAEFDPAKREFTFTQKTAPQMAMGMTEDDEGRIWSVTYPQSGVVSFDPETREFVDYGHVYTQNWRQYQRYVASDDTGWIYFGIGSTAAQIIAFDPETREAIPIVPEDKRAQGAGVVYRSVNGKVYGHGGNDDLWYELYEGEATPIEKPQSIDTKKYITSSQGLFHTAFPDGKVLEVCDTVERQLVVSDPATGEKIEHRFDYTSEGAHIMGLAAAPNGIICGGTAFPMRFFSYDPKADTWINRASFGQWNTVAPQGDKFFVGGYGGGFLLEWDPAGEWAPTVEGNPNSNPLFHTKISPVIHRPHDLLAHPNGKWVVLAGTPGYGFTGGGLLFWNRATMEQTVVEHTDLLPEHSTLSLAAIDDETIVGGSTVSAGTGGEQKATLAELYTLSLDTKRITWHEPLFPGVSGYTDLHYAKNGLVYGVADQRHYFVWDPKTREAVHEMALGDTFGSTISHQGPRVFVATDEGDLYMLFRKGIVSVDLESHELTMIAESPVSIGPGGDVLDGRIYFGSGSHVYSYELPDVSND